MPVWQPASSFSEMLRSACLHGDVGLRLFFAISGFLLSLPFAQARLAGKAAPSLGKYYLRRVTRLEPTYIVNTAIAFALLVAVDSDRVGELAPHFVASLFYLHDISYGAASPINAVAWSLEVEVQFYILAPFLCVVFSIAVAALRRAVIVVALIASASLLPHLGSIAFPQGLLVGQLPYFLAGMLLTDLYLTAWDRKSQQSLIWDLTALPAWLLIPFTQELPGPWVYYLPAAIIVAYVGAFRGIVGRRLFTNRWLVTIGGMCYTIYLYHCFVISFLGRVTTKLLVTQAHWSNMLVQCLLIGLPMIAVCSVLFLMFEKPFMYRDWPARLLSAFRGRRPE